MSEVKPCGHINTGVPCYCETPSPSTRAEAAPGGLREAAEEAGKAIATFFHHWKHGGISRDNTFHQQTAYQMRQAEAMLTNALATPAPNREAELKVIEAAKKLNAMWGDAQVNIGPTELALYKALASLAQSEMKGSKP